MPLSPDTRQSLPSVQVRAAGANWCLSARAVVAILRPEYLEGAPDGDGRLGWIPFGGERLPVYSLAEKLGSTASPGVSRAGAIVALESAWGRFAVAVDGVERLAGVPAGSPQPLPAVGPQSRFEGVVSMGGELILCLSADGLHPAAPPAVAAAPVRPAATAPAARTASAPAHGPVLLFSLPHLDAMFALSYAQVLEICGPTRLWPVPGWPAWIRGLVEWRGRPLPLVDLSACLGRSATPPERVRRFLIARPARTAEPLALAIGSEVRSMPLPLRHQPWSSTSPFRLEYVRGLFDADGCPLVVPDLDAILGGTAEAQRYRMVSSAPAPGPQPILAAADAWLTEISR